MFMMYFAGVKWGEWKAVKGECKKCSEDGGAGPIKIERSCKPAEGFSCDGLKNTDVKKGCIDYCPSRAGKMK